MGTGRVSVIAADAQAPAKLNLFLHVTGRRDDGFHDLQTVFQFVDLCDTLRFVVRDDEVLERTGGLAGLDSEQDLVIRAATALREAAGIRRGVSIDVRKAIPAGGGLGGGSSDAATTLVTLNRLWGIDWSIEQLAALGLTLGADVPVFIHGRAAWAEGVGERLVPIALPESWFLVVDPGVVVPTGEIFQVPELTRDTPRLTISDFVSGSGHNDFEPVVRARYPQVAAALDWLDNHGGGRLTGTGGCVFATFGTRDAAETAYDALPAGMRGFVTRGRNRSPLYAPIGA